jgi:hypothetical protein
MLRRQSYASVLIIGAAGATAGAAPDGLPSPEELLARMSESAAIQAQTAVGRYLRVDYQAQTKTEAQLRADVEDKLNMVRDSHAKRGAEGAAAFAKTEQRLRKDLERAQAATLGPQISVDTYYIAGGRHRTDRTVITQRCNDSIPPEERNPGEYARYARGHDIPPDTTVAWNGSVASEVLWSSLPVTPGQRAHEAADIFLRSEDPKPPKFLAYGREMPEPQVIEAIRAQRITMAVQKARSKDGDDALMLKVGEPGTIGVYIEMTVLPDKGYVTSETVIKLGGATVYHDEYHDYVLTTAGFHVPLRIDIKGYSFTTAGVPTLLSQTQLIALAPPEMNQPLDDSAFSIVPSARTVVSDLRAGRGKPDGAARRAALEPSKISGPPPGPLPAARIPDAQPEREPVAPVTPVAPRKDPAMRVVIATVAAIAAGILVAGAVVLLRGRRRQGT